MFSTFSQETTSPQKTFIQNPSNKIRLPVSTPISIPKMSDEKENNSEELHIDFNTFLIGSLLNNLCYHL
mgnify:CR=1 FL=1